MARKWRTHTPEFKVEAVKLVTEHGYLVAEAAPPSASARTSSATGSRPSRPTATKPSPATASSPLRGGVAPPPRREPAAADGAQHPKKATALFARDATGSSPSSTSTRASGRCACCATRWASRPATTPGSTAAPRGSRLRRSPQQRSCAPVIMQAALDLAPRNALIPKTL
jgi:hypothetical protein